VAAEQQSPLARQRLMRGYTQEELAEKVRTTVSTVRRWERGEVHPQPGTRRRLASELNVSLDQLATLLDGKPAAPIVADAPTGNLGQPDKGLAGADEAVNRRQFVIGSVGAVIGAAAIGPDQFRSSGIGLGRWADEAVAGHLGRTWHTLVATDNKFGPIHAVHGVLQSIRLASDALQQMSGADRQRVFQVDARFAESAAWLYEDMGDFAEASRWMQTAHQWADAASYPSLALWTLIGRARQAVLRWDAHTAVGLADQAINTATAAPAAMRREVASTQMNEPSRQRNHFVATRSDEERSARALSSTVASSGWTKSSSRPPTSLSASQPNTSLQAGEQYRYRPAGLTTVIMSAEAVTRDA
jgi:transcriptional regulator with XRE-family HTH domain